MRSHPGALALLALLLAGCRIPPEAMSPEALERHIAYLADDSLEGRDSGTRGGRKTEEYVLSQFRSAGLRGVEAQRFEFVGGARLGPRSGLAVAGRPLSAEEFRPYPFSAQGEGEWPAVFAGYGISASDLGHDDYQRLDVKGKAVVALAGSPDGESPHGKFSAHQGARAKALKAASLGAAALIVLVQQLPAFDGEDISRDVGLPVMAALAGSAAERLGIDLAAEGRSLAEGRRVGRTLDCSIRIRADVRLETRAARNIMGWLLAPGANPNELVIVGAHHDGLGRGSGSSMRRERRGEIHNGADDNASGVAGLIELARRMAPRAQELRRSVLFIAFAGEERGLLGSRHFAEHPVLAPRRDLGLFGRGALHRPVAMVNLDMVGRLRDQKLLISGVGTSDGWPALLARVEAKRQSSGAPALSLSAERTEDILGSSDHLSFYQIALPVILFFTGAHQDYHTPDDDLYRVGPGGERQLLINLEGLRDVMGLVEEVVVELSTMPAPPAHKPGVDLAPRMKFRVALRLMPDYGAAVEGMRIAEVNSDGPAARAGLRAGDVIVRFGSTPVRSVRDYMVGLEQAEAGQEIEVEYLRDGQRSATRVVPVSLAR